MKSSVIAYLDEGITRQRRAARIFIVLREDGSAADHRAARAQRACIIRRM